MHGDSRLIYFAKTLLAFSTSYSISLFALADDSLETCRIGNLETPLPPPLETPSHITTTTENSSKPRTSTETPRTLRFSVAARDLARFSVWRGVFRRRRRSGSGQGGGEAQGLRGAAGGDRGRRDEMKGGEERERD